MAEARITKDLSIEAYDKICRDIRAQPKWRLNADIDADYYDGAQLNEAVIAKLKEAGIPPHDSNLIKPTINAVLGLEARSRTDYKITSDDEAQAEIAEGLSAKIKEVETESRADRAISDAYSSMIRTGLGWVEVSREFNPLEYPYRVREVHRNEIFWDWFAKEPDLSDARYLRRDRWVDREQALKVFPDQAAVIENSWSGWTQTDVYDGNDSDMARAYENEQAWSQQHDDYLNRQSGMVKLSELWYRHFEEDVVLMLPNGRSVEYSPENPYHDAAIAQGLVQVQKALLPRVRVSIWLGPHKLMDVPSPLPHKHFPYVPFWCLRKDRRRTPYGLIRDMRGPQDQVIDLDIMLYEILNSRKIVVDNDALDLNQNTYQEVAQNMSSLRSMTVLNANRRNANGFQVTQEHQLAMEVMNLVQERKRRIEEVGGVYRAMLGQSTEASSGVAINNLVEQGSTVLAEPNDNFRYARRIVGEQLLEFIKADLAGQPAQITASQGGRKKIVYFNQQNGDKVINDITAAEVKVVLEDLPATPTFRAQQLQSFSQIVSAAPPQFQAVLYPAMLELSDVPNRHEIADQLRKLIGTGGEKDPQAQQMQQQLHKVMTINQGLQDQLKTAQQQLSDRSRELDIKQQLADIQAGRAHNDATLNTEEISQQDIYNTISERTGR